MALKTLVLRSRGFPVSAFSSQAGENAALVTIVGPDNERVRTERLHRWVFRMLFPWVVANIAANHQEENGTVGTCLATVRDALAAGAQWLCRLAQCSIPIA